LIINVSLLGYGSVSRKHVYALRNIPFYFPDYDVKAHIRIVYGRRKELVGRFAREYSIPSYTTSLEEAISGEYVDLVDIALPNYLHHVAGFKALERGKHVVCEKPLAINSELAWELYYAAQDEGVVHGVMYNYRWLPAIVLAKEMISKGLIGKVYHFRGIYLEDYGADPQKPLTWRYRKETAGSGTLGDNATHVIDLARYLVGEIVEVCSLGETFIKKRPLIEDPTKQGIVDTDDEFVSIIRFENDAIGTIEASRISHGRRNWLEIEIRGTKGYIQWNLNYLNHLEVYIVGREPEGPRRILVTDEEHPYIKRFWPPNAPIGLVEGFTIAFAELLKAIKERKEYKPSFKDGAVNCTIIDAMLESWRKHRCVEVKYPEKL